MQTVLVTGLGLISPLGHDADTLFAHLLAGHSAVRQIAVPNLAPQVVAPVDFDPTPWCSTLQLTGVDRVSQFAVAAASNAMRDAKLSAGDYEAERLGVYLGCGMGGAQTLDVGYHALYREQKRVPPLTVIGSMVNAPAAHISMRHDARGPVMTYAMACASGAVAIGEALKALRAGEINIALAGGAEALLTPGTISAWDALRTLAPPDAEQPSRSCKPFSANRKGLVLGEGAALVVLETAAHAQARAAVARVSLVGYGNASDATHIAKPDARGQIAALRKALSDAKLHPTQIGYVNAHGTGTLAGDVVETRAIHAVWGADAARLAVSATKSMHGHLMGAAGALEFVITVLALEQGMLPPTAHLEQGDPECDLDYVPNVARSAPNLRWAMTNSFGFGGSNACLIVERNGVHLAGS